MKGLGCETRWKVWGRKVHRDGTDIRLVHHPEVRMRVMVIVMIMMMMTILHNDHWQKHFKRVNCQPKVILRSLGDCNNALVKVCFTKGLNQSRVIFCYLCIITSTSQLVLHTYVTYLLGFHLFCFVL